MKLAEEESQIIIEQQRQLLERMARLEKKIAGLERISLTKKIERAFRKQIVNPIRERVFPPPKVLGNSIPKSGTHLLANVLYTTGFRNPFTLGGSEHPQVFRLNTEEVIEKITSLNKGEYFFCHHFFDKELSNVLKRNKIKHVLIVRDPRGIAVSRAIYMTRPEHHLFSHFGHLSQRDRIIATINGIPGVTEGTAQFFKNYLPWLKEDCLVIKFEDLIGSRGGGSDEQQLKTLKRITKYLGIFFREKRLEKIAFKTFNEKSCTFRRGQIGDWSNWLDEEMLDLLKKDDDVFKEYGYSI